MADAAVLKEFLVGVGYKVDESSQDRFTKGLAGAGAAVAKVQQGVQQFGKSIADLGKRLVEHGERPVRQYEEATRKIGISTEKVLKSVVELGAAAVATGTAFVGAMRSVAVQYEQLYYVAQRIGTSVEDLNKMRFAADRAGLGADEFTASLEALNHTMRASPGLKVLVDSWIGADWDTLKNKSEGQIKVLEHLRQLPRYIAYEWASKFGISAKLLDQYFADPEAYRKAREEADRIFKIIGVNQKELAEKSVTFMQTLGTLAKEVGGIFQQAFIESFPQLMGYFKTFQGMLEGLLRWNEAHPGMAMVEAIAAAGVGIVGLLGLLGKLRWALFTLTPVTAALAGAAYLIIKNWDRVGPFLKKHFDDIYAAFQRSPREGFRALWEAAKETFSAIATYVKDEFRKIDWQEVGKVAGDAFTAAWKAALGVGKWLEDLIDEQLKKIDFPALGSKLGTALGKALEEAFTGQIDSADPTSVLLKKLGEANARVVKIGQEFMAAFFRGMWEQLKNDPTLVAIEEAFDKVFGWPGRIHDRLFGKTPAAAAPAPAPAAPAPARAPAVEAEPPRPERKPEPPAALEDRFGGPSWQIGPPPPGMTDVQMPGGHTVQLPQLNVPHMQHGGIVRADLHEGEMVLPLWISRGLQALISGGQKVASNVGGALSFASERVGETLDEWLTGTSGRMPQVKVGNVDDIIDGMRDLEDERAAEGKPTSATVQGPPEARRRRGAGGGGDSGEMPGDLNLAGSEFLASQRKQASEELEKSPELMARLAAIVSLEASSARGRIAIAESLFNRIAEFGGTVEGRTGGGKGSFYGPVRRGEVAPRVQELLKDPQRLEALKKLIRQAYSSNITKGYTDQGSIGATGIPDPNYYTGGSGITIDGERHNYYLGDTPEHRAWRERQQAQVDKSASVPPTAVPGAALVPGGMRPRSALTLPMPNIPRDMPWDRIGAASARLDRIQPLTMNGGGTTTNEGNRDVTMNITNHITVAGGSNGAAETGRQYSDLYRRLYGDMIRDMKPALT
jgi:hypothetical protein